MGIDFLFLLKRNNMTLEQFIEKNNIENYQALLKYCEDKWYNPPDYDECAKSFSIKPPKKIKLGSKKAKK